MPSPDISPPPLKRRRRISGGCPPQLQHPSPPPPSPLPSSSASIPNSIHIYSWNINGIAPFLPPSTPPITTFLNPPPTSSKTTPPPPSLRANLQRWNWPHILCLQEVKIAPTDTKTQTTLLRVLNTPLPSSSDNENPTPHHHLYSAHFSLPRDPHNATGFGGKVYGVCTILRHDIPAPTTTRAVEWDLEGRVLLTEIPTWALVIMNVYAVNGTTHDYRDPATGKVVGNRHDRKRVFHSLLRDEVRRYEDQGWDVVVAGDINISREGIDSFPGLRMGEEHVRNRVDFEEKFIRGLGMVDTFREVRGLQRKFTYRPRGKRWGEGGDRVDLILVTKGLGGEGRVRDADVLDCEGERGTSDHVPLFVEIGVGRGGGGVGTGEG